MIIKESIHCGLNFHYCDNWDYNSSSSGHKSACILIIELFIIHCPVWTSFLCLCNILFSECRPLLVSLPAWLDGNVCLLVHRFSPNWNNSTNRMAFSMWGKSFKMNEWSFFLEMDDVRRMSFYSPTWCSTGFNKLTVLLPSGLKEVNVY